MTRYLRDHWRGDQSLVIATLINGVLGYVVGVAVMFGLSEFVPGNAGIYIGAALALVWAVWASVGIVRCAFKYYVPAGQPAWRRAVGLGVIALVVVNDVLLARDVWFIFGLIST